MPPNRREPRPRARKLIFRKPSQNPNLTPRTRMKKYGIPILILILILFALVSLPMLNARDLDIPGLEEATAPASSGDAPGTA